jgi:hypothetical protein
MHVPLLRRLLLPLALLLTFVVTTSSAQAACSVRSSCATAHAAKTDRDTQKQRTAKKQRTAQKHRRSTHRDAQRKRHVRGHEAKKKKKSRRKATTRRTSATKRRAAARPKQTTAPRHPAPRVATPPAAPSAPAPTSRPSSPRTSTSPSGGRPTRLFADSSIWNRPLTGDVRIDPTSPARMQGLIDELHREMGAGTGPWINDTRWSAPVYRVSSSQRRVPVTIDNGSWADSLRRALARGVPSPDDAKPAWGSDAHMVIYQASTDTMWEFWRASKQADGWHAVWGGVMENVSDNPGYYDNTAVAGLAADEGWGWGSTATSLPVAGGLITIDDLRSGSIDHALALSVPDACAGSFAWPAQRGDGKLTTADCLHEGARLRLDPSMNLDAMNLPPITLMMARAAQKYGILIRDVTHSVVSFSAEDPTPTGSNPYTGVDGLYGGLGPWKVLRAFPWRGLQLVQMKLCSRGPCEQGAGGLRASSKRAKHHKRTTHHKRVKQHRR